MAPPRSWATPPAYTRRRVYGSAAAATDSCSTVDRVGYAGAAGWALRGARRRSRVACGQATDSRPRCSAAARPLAWLAPQVVTNARAPSGRHDDGQPISTTTTVATRAR